MPQSSLGSPAFGGKKSSTIRASLAGQERQRASLETIKSQQDMNFPTPPNPSPHDPASQTSARQQQPVPNSQPPHHQYPQSAQQGHQQQQQLHQQGQYQHQQHTMMNGMNGAGMPAGMPLPTPAGHQAELNYIYGMVEELSRQLADNRRVTEDIVSGLGKVRSKAKTQDLTNGDVLRGASSELSSQEQNLDALVSLLTESLEKAKYSRDANASLLSQYANALALMLKQFHEYKTKHVTDVAAWHRSYRKQLVEARDENSRLREQIWQMQCHAGKANENLRDFRCKYDEDEARWDRRVDEKAIRQELRFWKRMAMPDLDDDDPYWSDDDDIIDPAEKERLRVLDLKAAEEQLDSQAEDSDGQHLPSMSMMGGIAMKREDSSLGHVMPPPPPRPLSAASSTGSTGQ